MGVLNYAKAYLGPLLQVQILPQLNVVSSPVDYVSLIVEYMVISGDSEWLFECSTDVCIDEFLALTALRKENLKLAGS